MTDWVDREVMKFQPIGAMSPAEVIEARRELGLPEATQLKVKSGLPSTTRRAAWINALLGGGES